LREPAEVGPAEPELLKDNPRGYWSRRITQGHRLEYVVAGKEVRIAQCRFYYDDK